MSLHVPSQVTALPGYRLFLRFADDTEGTIDLSTVVGEGVFRRWQEIPLSFQSVQIAEDGSLVWEGGIDLCSDALYLEISGKPVEEVFPRLKSKLQPA